MGHYLSRLASHKAGITEAARLIRFTYRVDYLAMFAMGVLLIAV